jgi:hypothetical protein
VSRHQENEALVEAYDRARALVAQWEGDFSFGPTQVNIHERARQELVRRIVDMVWPTGSTNRSPEAKVACDHEWTHRCGKCGLPSELDGITETDRSSALASFRKILAITEHDSKINQIAAEAVAHLVHAADPRPSEASPDDSLRGRIAARIDGLMSAAEDAFEVADDTKTTEEMRARMSAKGHRLKATAHELGRLLVPTQRPETAIPKTSVNHSSPPSTASAGRDNAEVAKNETAPAGGPVEQPAPFGERRERATASYPDGTDADEPADRGFVCVHEAELDAYRAALAGLVAATEWLPMSDVGHKYRADAIRLLAGGADKEASPEKTSAWTEEERREMKAQRELDEAVAFAHDDSGNRIRVSRLPDRPELPDGWTWQKLDEAIARAPNETAHWKAVAIRMRAEADGQRAQTRGLHQAIAKLKKQRGIGGADMVRAFDEIGVAIAEIEMRAPEPIGGGVARECLRAVAEIRSRRLKP